jgi:arylsulfatase A-like enzyme
MRWIHALAVVLLLAGTGGLPPRAAAAEAKRPPNLVLILSDDHRWDLLGAAGNPAARTPHLDDLARRGAYFRQATIHVSQCPPSRATLLTGLPPHRHGLRSAQMQEPKAGVAAELCRQTLPSLLAARDYDTALVGKWHLQPDPWQCGFAEVKTWIPFGAADYRNPELAQGRSRELHKRKGYTQEILTQDATDFLRARKPGDKPFFLWVAFTAPHLPYAPNPPRIQALYKGKTARQLLPPGFPPQEPLHEQWTEYYEAVSHLDEQIGRLMQALREGGHADDTVVVFLGDNGYMMGERGIGLEGTHGKVVPYESSLRVPFLIAGLPEPMPRGASDLPASSLDIPATLLALAGIAPPADWPGRNLVAALRGEEALGEAISEWADDQSERWGSLAFRVIRTNRHKLIDWQDPGKPDELYDHVADPRESRNLIDDLAVAAVREDLVRRLRAWRERTGDLTPGGTPGAQASSRGISLANSSP